MVSLTELRDRAVPWGILVLRIMFSCYLAIDGIIRIDPEFIEKTPETVQIISFFPPDSVPFMVVGLCECFFAVLVFFGFCLRIALGPLLLFFVIMLLKQLKAQGTLISPVYSASEEYFLLSGITLSFLIMGPGRLSIQRMFFSKDPVDGKGG